ncbi:MAG: sulfate adenylyltransferase, partial [Candidatus Neomarinimicrobiota bacterium]
MSLPEPHGGCGLINRFLPDTEKDYILRNRGDFKVYRISEADVSVFYRIADGVLSPLEGPMVSEEFDRVLEEEVIIRNGEKYAWTIPISFPVHRRDADNFVAGETVLV